MNSLTKIVSAACTSTGKKNQHMFPAVLNLS